MFGNIGPWELILILVIVLVVFGPGKLPKVGESLGKAMQSFKKASQGEDEEEVSKVN
jgi:sec-independent protein translocase protein TatA